MCVKNITNFVILILKMYTFVGGFMQYSRRSGNESVKKGVLVQVAWGFSRLVLSRYG